MVSGAVLRDNEMLRGWGGTVLSFLPRRVFRSRVGMIGGITQAKKIAALCEQFGVQTAFQEGGEYDPINQLLAYHLDLTIPSFGIQEEHEFPELVHEMMPGTAKQRKGYL